MSTSPLNSPPSEAGTPTAALPRPASTKLWKKPVGWLLGPELLTSLQQIVLSMLYREKIDIRTWMQPTVFDPLAPRPGEALPQGAVDKDGAFWFDYIADSGDGQRATYSVACMCLSDLHQVGGQLQFAAPKEGPPELVLPRGQFLLVGGDTAYHVADERTLIERFLSPFAWAYADLTKLHQQPPASRPLLGIPGNHDTYDQLNGYSRVFLQSSPTEKVLALADSAARPRNQPLDVAGFYRVQTATYTAITLPHRWWLWAVDAESEPLDARQIGFFKGKDAKAGAKDGVAPDRLIVVSAEPTTVFGRYPRSTPPTANRPWEGTLAACTYAQLDLPLVSKPVAARADAPVSPASPVAAGQIRLDLSGDVHHYARYFGPDRPELRVGTAPKAPINPSYASVVSGLGGAFLHPTHTDFGELRPQALYPAVQTSRNEFAKRLVDPRTIPGGGSVGYFGALLSFLIIAATLFEPRHWNLLDTIARVLSHPLVLFQAGERGALLKLMARDLSSLTTSAIFLGGVMWLICWLAPALRLPGYLAEKFDRAGALFYLPSGLCVVVGISGFFVSYRIAAASQLSVNQPSSLAIDFVIALLLLGLLGGTVLGLPLAGKKDLSSRWLALLCPIGLVHFVVQAFFPLILLQCFLPLAFLQTFSPWILLRLLFIAVAIGVVMLAGWLLSLIWRAKRLPLRLGESLLTILWIVTILGSTWLPAGMSAKLHKGEHSSHVTSWPTPTAAAVLPAPGQSESVATAPVVSATPPGSHPSTIAAVDTYRNHTLIFLIVFAVLAGGGAVVADVLQWRKTSKRSPLSWIFSIIWALTVVGAVIFWLLVGRSELETMWRVGIGSSEAAAHVLEFIAKLTLALLGAAIGYGTSCLWFSGYLLVSDAWNAHNNEVGGAARIEDYKQILRIKLERDSMTVYAIAIDRVGTDVTALQPRLVDQFTLKPTA